MPRNKIKRHLYDNELASEVDQIEQKFDTQDTVLRGYYTKLTDYENDEDTTQQLKTLIIAIRNAGKLKLQTLLDELNA